MENEDFKLEEIFILSLVRDVATVTCRTSRGLRSRRLSKIDSVMLGNAGLRRAELARAERELHVPLALPNTASPILLGTLRNYDDDVNENVT